MPLHSLSFHILDYFNSGWIGSFFKSDSRGLRTGRERWQCYGEDSGRGSLVCTSRRWRCMPGGLPAPCCHHAGAQRGLLHQHSGTAPFVPPGPAATASLGHPIPQPHSRPGLGGATRGSGGRQASTRTRALARGEKLEVKCLKVRSLFSMNLLYLILSTNSNLIASGLKPLQ